MTISSFMDDPWFHIAQTLVNDDEDLLSVLARMRCLLTLTTLSRSIHHAVGVVPFVRLGDKYARDEERTIAARGVPSLTDVAGMRDSQLLSTMGKEYDVLLPSVGPAWRTEMIAAVNNTIMSPTFECTSRISPRVGPLLRLVVRRVSSYSMSRRDAVHELCLDRVSLDLLPRAFPSPLLSTRAPSITGMPWSAVVAAALTLHGSMEVVRTLILTRKALFAARAASAAQAARRRNILVDLIGRGAGLSPDAIRQRQRTWHNLTHVVFAESDDKQIASPTQVAKKITRAYVRCPQLRYVDAARQMCEVVEAREASVMQLCDMMAQYRIHDVVSALQRFVYLGGEEDTARVERLVTAWTRAHDRMQSRSDPAAYIRRVMRKAL